eukprot:1192996-Prorocentrum_minimum.AAC.2
MTSCAHLHFLLHRCLFITRFCKGGWQPVYQHPPAARASSEGGCRRGGAPTEGGRSRGGGPSEGGRRRSGAPSEG